MTHIRTKVLNVSITGTGTEQATGIITDEVTSVTFSIQMKSILIYNTGGNTVHWKEASDVTTSDFPISSGGRFSIDAPMKTIYFICNTNRLTTVSVVGIK